MKIFHQKYRICIYKNLHLPKVLKILQLNYLSPSLFSDNE